MSQEFEPKVDVINFANTTVLNPAGDPIRLGLLWQKQTVVFIFLRHFACIACRSHAKQVWNEREKYEKAGGKLVFIGNGQPGYIEKFREDLGMEDAAIYTDPSLQSFRAAGFRHGFFYVVHPQTLGSIARMTWNGDRQTVHTKEAGTHWQLGGVLVINSTGKNLYHYISEYMGDFPDQENIRVITEDEKKRQIKIRS